MKSARKLVEVVLSYTRYALLGVAGAILCVPQYTPPTSVLVFNRRSPFGVLTWGCELRRVNRLQCG